MAAAGSTAPATPAHVALAARGEQATKRLASDVPADEHKSFLLACTEEGLKAAPVLRALAQLYVEDPAVRERVRRAI